MDESVNTEPKKGNSMMLIGIIVILAVVGIGFFMMNRTQSSQSGDTSMQEGQPTQDEAMTAEESADVMVETSTEAGDSQSGVMEEEGSVKTFTLEAGSFYYKPNVIRVKKGDTVKVVMNSVDMQHDFKIDELNIAIPVTKSGESNSVEFTVDTVGEFEFYCSVGQHRADGQVGTLIVEE